MTFPERAAQPSDRPRRWGALQWSLVVVILLVAGVSAWRERPVEISTGGDEAVYLILAESLGAGRYHDEFTPGTPPHRRYPPGNAAWIAALSALPGAGLDMVRLANLLLWLGAALLTGDALRRLAGPWPGVVAATAVAANPALSRLAPTALSDIPFMAIAVATAWAMLRAETSARARSFAGLAIAGAVTGFLMRTPGLALFAAVIVGAAWEQRWRTTIIATLACTAVVGAWFAYTRVAGVSAVPGQAGYSYEGALNAVGAESGLVAQVFSHAVGYTRMLPGEALSLPTIAGTPLDNLALGVLLAASLGSGMLVFARQWRGAGLFMAGYIALLLLWPWLLPRLLLPLIPFLTGAVVAGCAASTAKRPVWRQAALGMTIAVLVIPGLLDRARADRPAPSSYIAAIRDLGAHLPAGTPVASWRPSVVYQLSGFRGTDLTLRRREGNHALEGVLFVGDTGPNERRFVATVLAPRCSSLRLVATLPAPNLLLAAGAGASDGTAGDACRAIEAYRARSVGRGGN